MFASNTPAGPAECLFEKPYYDNIKAALTPGGILSSEGEGRGYSGI